MAWQEFRRGKRARDDVREFEFNIEDNLFSLHECLRAKTYVHMLYAGFYVSDPKLRHIHKATVRDRVVHQAIFRKLYPVFDPGFIFDSYSCRFKKGTHAAVRRLASFAKKASGNNQRTIWALKCDIKKFFDSINHKTLLELLKEKISDPEVLWLLLTILHSFEKEHGWGLPLGNVTSQLFANIYLNEFDQFIKRELKRKYYLRYCDDFIIIADNEAEARAFIAPIEKFLATHLSLSIHKGKISIKKYRQGIDFVGYVVRPHHVLLRTRTKKRIFNAVRRKSETSNFRNSLDSYLGILKHCRGFNIQKIILTKIKK